MSFGSTVCGTIAVTVLSIPVGAVYFKGKCAAAVYMTAVTFQPRGRKSLDMRKPGAIIHVLANTGRAVLLKSDSGTTTVDGIALVENADVQVEKFDAETGAGVYVTAKIPWTALADTPPKLEPGSVIWGDVGIVLAKPDGTGAADRIMWANKVPAVIGDIAAEARIVPQLWGRFKVEGGK